MHFKLSLITAAVVAVIAAPAMADNEKPFEQISIIGSQNAVNDVPGSASYVGEQEIAEFKYTDIMRVLSVVPGVYVMEEDGYGLRPNIGMRGVSINRSEKITVMEDGVLAAPAAYSAPSAYYFPTFGRMSAVEVLKGSSGVMYGPRTTGGVLNLLSRSIPSEDFTGSADISLGEDGYQKLHGYVGGSSDGYSGVVEYFRYQADGFKTLPNGGGTGFTKNDFLAKFRVDSGDHSIEFKYKYSDESSDETYLGLTEADYTDSPYRRYAASQLDNMDTEHNSYQVNYEYQLSDSSSFNVTAYYNDFHRNWYKTSNVGGKKLGKGAEELASAYEANPDGGLDVDVKANNRDYLSQGIQSQLLMDIGDHQLTFGVRLHKDEMDRFQWVDKYSLGNSLLMMYRPDGKGVPGTDSNRIDSAQALAIYVHDEFSIGDLVLSGGLRFEDMTIERDEWKFDGNNDITRASAPKHESNDTAVVLPSFGLTYTLNDNLVLLGGVQKGFAPAAPGNDSAEEEKSWNYEAGLRFNQNGFKGELIGFYSDYSNMHGNCTASQGCDDDNIGNQYNAGEVEIKGMELQLGYDLDLGKLSMPLSLAYTYSSSEFQNDFDSDFSVWGDVVAGDEIPYIPEQQLRFKVGLTHEIWEMSLAARYMSQVRTSAGQGAIDPTESINTHTIWDLSARYNVADNQQVYMSIDNLFDKVYVASRANGGIQPGKYRTLQLGYTYRF